MYKVISKIDVFSIYLAVFIFFLHLFLFIGFHNLQSFFGLFVRNDDSTLSVAQKFYFKQSITSKVFPLFKMIQFFASLFKDKNLFLNLIESIYCLFSNFVDENKKNDNLFVIKICDEKAREILTFRLQSYTMKITYVYPFFLSIFWEKNIIIFILTYFGQISFILY